MEKLLSTLSTDEKIRLLNGDGSWKTWSANGKLPYFVMSDGPHGLRKQDEEKYADLNKSRIATCFPTASCMASSWNKNSLYTLGQAIGKEALKEKVNMVLGPGVNIKRSPLCGRNFEYFSEDPYLAGTLAANYINGMQKLGVAACVKHFAANNQEKRRQTSCSIIDERTFREIYLRAFEIVVKNSAPIGIMGSYNKINGEYACASKKLLTQILRNEWGFKGIVISDWGACINAATCVNAGMDLAMPDSCGYLTESLKKSLADKLIDEAQISISAERILKTAQWFKENTKFDDYQVDYNLQHETAKNLAIDSAVLLKNNDFLPLKPKSKIAVIGELAEFMKFQGGGSSHITTKEYPNAIQALETLGFEVSYSKGYYSGFCKEKQLASKNHPLQQAALEFAKDAAKNDLPILFFTGLTERYEGEGFDRETLSLPTEQTELLQEILKITQKVAVINFCGAPVDFSPCNNVQAILQMYLAGEAVGEAVAEIVSGNSNPSGKLAETWPLKNDDVSCIENFAKETDNVPYKETLFVGYRHTESHNIPVQYEFGFGLSYTKFEYNNLQTKTDENGFVTVSVDVKNAGNCDGAEIIQVYVAPELSDEEKFLRSAKELRGFEKVFLKKDECKTVEIPLDENAFKIFSTDKNTFVTIGGKYTIQAAASVKDVKLQQEIQITGEKLLDNACSISEEFFTQYYVEPHHKGSFTISDSLGDMAKESKFMAGAVKTIETGLVLASKSKTREDPSVKIALSAIKENPLESLLSTSGGAITEKLANWFVKKANK